MDEIEISPHGKTCAGTAVAEIASQSTVKLDWGWVGSRSVTVRHGSDRQRTKAGTNQEEEEHDSCEEFDNPNWLHEYTMAQRRKTRSNASIL